MGARNYIWWAGCGVQDYNVLPHQRKNNTSYKLYSTTLYSVLHVYYKFGMITHINAVIPQSLAKYANG